MREILRPLRYALFVGVLLLTLYTLSGCAHAPVACQPLPRPVQMPAPPPGMFNRCLREILLEAQAGVKMSPQCSSFLSTERTKPAPTSEKPKT